MDNNETPNENKDNNFGQEIVKSFTISTASMAGVLVAFMAVGLAANKFKELKETRKAKKTKKED